MRAEFDGAAFDAWLEREDETMWQYQCEEETPEGARARMTDVERTADLEWEQTNGGREG